MYFDSEPDPVPPDPPDPPSSLNFQPSGSRRTEKRRLEQDDEARASKTMTPPSTSIQTIYTDPSLVVGSMSYSAEDKGPYVVHVSRSEPDLAAGTTIRPIKFGQFLKFNKIENICPDGIKKVGRNKISVEFKSAADANKFLSMDVLSSNKYVSSIPTYNITRMGIIRHVPADMSMHEFVESLELPANCGKILKARRLNRKVVEEGKTAWVPTQSVVVTFRGQVLPTKVFLYYTSLPVEIYLFPTIQCLSCCRFGHTKAQCRSKPKCFRCGDEHSADSCLITEQDSVCMHCSGRHFATNKNCPEQVRQKSIKAFMAHNIVSYEEAASHFPKASRSYAEVSQQISSPSLSSVQASLPLFPSQTQSQSRRSQPKTIYASPRQISSRGKGYDKVAHSAIVVEPTPSLRNGCAILDQSSEPSSYSNDMLESLVNLIIQIILNNRHPLPSNVATKLTQLVSLSPQHGSSSNTAVEHPEYAS